MIKSYKKKPVVVRAIEYTGDNAADVINFTNGAAGLSDFSYSLEVATLEGTMRAEPGCYIIQGVQGEFYPCAGDIFRATYTEVDATE